MSLWQFILQVPTKYSYVDIQLEGEKAQLQLDEFFMLTVMGESVHIATNKVNELGILENEIDSEQFITMIIEVNELDG